MAGFFVIYPNLLVILNNILSSLAGKDTSLVLKMDTKYMKLMKGFISMVCIFFFFSCSKPVSVNSLLKEMADRRHLSYYPEEQYRLKQRSSYNPASIAPDKDGWFANADMSHFIRVENLVGRREFVMFDAQGPGAIVRWWMTFYKAQNGILRIYIDNDSIPAIKGYPHDVLSGTAIAGYPFAASVQKGAPRGEEGRDYDHNFYFPIPYAKHCKITYECDSLVLKYDYEGIPVEKGYYWPDVFYNICYREYAKNVKVDSYSQKALEKARLLLCQTTASLLDTTANSQTYEELKAVIIPGDSFSLEFSRPNSAIDQLAFDIKASDPDQALRSMVISVTFDGHRTVWVPIGEFFGTGYTMSPHSTWMNQTFENGTMVSSWIMPYQKTCRITFLNFGTDVIRIHGRVGLSDYEWKTNSMYFGSAWHEYNHIKTRDENNKPFDMNYVKIRGKGIYAGDQATLFNTSYEWWGEGDEKIFVDGEKFPSSFGTGSEDYYGYSFGRPDPFSHPFLSQPIGKGNSGWGITVNMRHRSLDAIPFTDSISSNIEMWHWAVICMNFALTSYYYITFPANVNIIPDVKSVQRAVAKSKNDFPDKEE